MAAFEYNGLGHRIGHQWDKDADTDLDQQWLVYDDKWRVIARFEDGADLDKPFEQVYHHHAGLAGYGSSSYIDSVICRDRDTNTGSAGFETREYVLQNWRADVVALAAPDGDLIERVSYDPYGIPFATHPTDLTHGATGGVAGYGAPSGTLTNDDEFYYLTLYGAPDWRADWNRDGTVNATDYTVYLADKAAASGSWGRGVLSNRQNILGYAGYVQEPTTGAAGGGHGTMYHCRLRVHHAGLGRWIQRDPPQFEYGEGPSLYWYGAASPVATVDWMGGSCAPTGCETDPASVCEGTCNEIIPGTAMFEGTSSPLSDVWMQCKSDDPLAIMCIGYISNNYFAVQAALLAEALAYCMSKSATPYETKCEQPLTHFGGPCVCEGVITDVVRPCFLPLKPVCVPLENIGAGAPPYCQGCSVCAGIQAGTSLSWQEKVGECMEDPL